MIILLSFIICLLLICCYCLRKNVLNLNKELSYCLLQLDDAKKKANELEIKLIKARSSEIK